MLRDRDYIHWPQDGVLQPAERPPSDNDAIIYEPPRGRRDGVEVVTTTEAWVAHYVDYARAAERVATVPRDRAYDLAEYLHDNGDDVFLEKSVLADGGDNE